MAVKKPLVQYSGTISELAAGDSLAYLASSDIGSTVQGYDGDLQAIGALAGTSGILKKTAANTWTLDTATFLVSTDIGSTVQGYDGDLNAIAALAGTSGLLKKTAANTWTLDTATYLTSAAIGSSVQAYDADLDTWATKTAPSGTPVGTTDTQTLTNKTLTGPKETTFTITDGAGFSIDPANGGMQAVTLGASRTPVLAVGFAAGHAVLLKVTTSSTYTITWTSINPTWIAATDAAGSAPTLSTTRPTHIEIWKDGSTTYAALVGYG